MIKLKNLTSAETKELLVDDLILLAYRGSIAHGMYIPPKDPTGIDDKDLMGIFIAPLNHYLGFMQKDYEEYRFQEYDVVHYEIRKWFRLLLKSNPNVMSLLWLEKNLIVYEHPLAQSIRDNRDFFVSKQAYHSFTGYAYGQLKRMTNYHFEGYMGEKRKQLVEQFGYDTKNAAHLIRLLRMGIEFLTDGELHVLREDATELLDIKKGKWTLEQVQKTAEGLFQLSKEAYIKSVLPDKPNYAGAEQLLIRTILDYLHLQQDRKAITPKNPIYEV